MVLLDQMRLNFRVMQLFAAIAENGSVDMTKVAEMADLVADMAAKVPMLAKALKGLDDAG